MKSCFALNLNSKVLLDPESGHLIIPTNSFKTETIFYWKSCCYYILKPPLFSEKQVKEGKDALGEGANIVPTKNNLDEEEQQLDCSKMSQPFSKVSSKIERSGRTIAATFIVGDASLKRGDDKDQES